MNLTEALELAITALKAQAELLNCDQRAVDILGAAAGTAAQKHVRERKELLEAAEVLKLHQKEISQ